MQWKLEFCAVTFKEICEVIFENVALRCFESAVKSQFSECCMHTGIFGVTTRVVTRILGSRVSEMFFSAVKFQGIAVQ